MAKRQYTRPLLVRKEGAERLPRVHFSDRMMNERWLQDLLFENPALIPVAEIEAAFAPLTPVAREVPTPAGPLDLLFINSDGYPTLVETKLWRNPQARRQVVSQIIDYAKDFAEWSYTDLAKAVGRTDDGGGQDDPLWAAVAEEQGTDEDDELDDYGRQQFVETVERNLRRGTFLLLIIGDGIREGVEQMTAYLQQTPSLNFTLALVEMAVYRLDAKQDEPLLVQPRVVTRTQEVVRAVVRIEGELPEGMQASVEVPAQKETGGRTTITEDAFLEELRKTPRGDEAKAFAERVIRAIEASEIDGLQVEWKAAGPSFRYLHPEEGFSLGWLRNNGQMKFAWIYNQCRRAAISTQIATDYLGEISKWIPEAKVARKPRITIVHPGRKGKRPLVTDLLGHEEDWVRLIEETVGRIREALEEGE